MKTSRNNTRFYAIHFYRIHFYGDWTREALTRDYLSVGLSISGPDLMETRIIAYIRRTLIHR